MSPPGFFHFAPAVRLFRRFAFPGACILMFATAFGTDHG
jgi:hypothetical protein